VNANKDTGMMMGSVSHAIILARNVMVMSMMTVYPAKKIGFWKEVSVFVCLSWKKLTENVRKLIIVIFKNTTRMMNADTAIGLVMLVMALKTTSVLIAIKQRD